MQRIERNVIIKATRSAVWDALTDPGSIREWMGEPEMRVEIITDWKVDEPILITGFHHVAFENKGTILCFEPERILRYTHLSSLSRLPDEPQNYCVLSFELAPAATGTSLTLTVDNFPTESIYKHFAFYWGTTMEVLKNFVEQRHAVQ